MTQAEPDLLFECLEELTERRACGQHVDLLEYRARLGDSWSEFEYVARIEALFDEAMDPELDDTLPRVFGPYTLLRELGRGAVGVVYEAHHPGLDRRVALKVLRPGLETNPKTRQRYEREARACARVRHDHIVEIYEAGEVEGRPYYAMALIQGEPLSRQLARETRPDPLGLCEALAGIAEALHALHEADVVHRDVKPSNIVIEPSGRYVLADFGLARIIERSDVTETADTLGTPLYMSPEQIESPRSVDGRTDVYALGATLYQGLTGKPPFDAESYAALVHQVIGQRPRSPSELAGDVPEAAAHIALKCLEKRPDDRYDSAAALAEDLRAFADGRPVSGRPVSRHRRWMRAAGRRPIGVLAVFGLAALFGWLLLDRTTTPSDAQITIRTVPAGEVAVADGKFLPSPATLRVPSGSARLRLRPRSERFRPMEMTLDLSAGDKLERMILFPLKQEDDPAARAQIVEALLDMQAAQVREISQDRGRPLLALQLLFPRGKVRARDVKHARIDISPAFAGRAQASDIVFLQEGEVGRVPFSPTSLTTEIEIPASVLDAARKGPVEWHVRGQPARRATFEIIDSTTTGKVRDDLARAAASVGGLSGTGDVAGLSRRLFAPYVRAHVLLHHGLAAAAFSELEAAPEQALPLLRLQQEALRRILGDDLTRTTIGRKLAQRIANHPGGD